MNTVFASSSFRLGVRPGSPHWQILCTPGPLATLFHHLAHPSTGTGPANLEDPVPVEEIGGHSFAVIPLTPELDEALAGLVDTFIDLRYETGRVQLELFAEVV